MLSLVVPPLIVSVRELPGVVLVVVVVFLVPEVEDEVGDGEPEDWFCKARMVFVDEVPVRPMP